MKYYELQPGDYVQQGDEYFSVQANMWLPVHHEFFGHKYGYDYLNPNKPARWSRIRRTVPDGFTLPVKQTIYIQEQWGEDFEI